MTFDAGCLKYDSAGLIPAIIQDADTNIVLMMAYMNKEALEKTLATGETWFWSRSRQKLWHKGETSGNVQKVQEITYDCDRDTLLIRVKQTGAACHEGYYTCFHYRINPETGQTEVIGEQQFNPEEVYGPKSQPEDTPTVDDTGNAPAPGAAPAVNALILEELYQVIKERQEKRPPGSYTAKLFNKGLDKMLEKLGEETTELIIEAKNRDREEVIKESADVLYHLLVILAEQGITPAEVFAELAERRKDD
ncbi:bifunctional phosphoribosyl-AMP cyclohydrolase/phosphoribosyl-ATP diphosphatase HisIE [Desulfofundulus salinus]|uniref:Histidine biosynthesis bifunctional protein HisIE n=1 Tax=Desulfofundulus salinus TaxID=2419843 RepID=A0A494WUA7_9FIRM|nr:bifunctional phosphoribosyl-AMP cyclohydrolase/phosphoribosyl-ATP diphosphatase HisIE [Desulfofundulus salinum]RKO66978.1 bifunctional phosphoribosyl-AMP cyclohydrolase/phosphoribosyl-ATP diphosphatase HisIE [Desulfofundulus salinum]